jgi:chemotaxis protein histidine kinase CheA
MTNPNDDLSQDPALVRDFLVESEELLQGMDQDMVALESSPGDADLLNRIFRTMHTIKGTSGFLAFDPVVRLSHRAEDVLNAIRRGEVQLDRRCMDALLVARDQLGVMLQDIRQGGLKAYALENLLTELADAQKPRSTPPTLGELLVKDGVITPAAIDTLLAEQAASPEPRRLGELAIEKGLTSPVQVGDALVRQKEIAESAAMSQSMRVDARKLDELINLVGELVLERNRLTQLSRDFASRKLVADDLRSVVETAQVNLKNVHSVEGCEVLCLRGETLPLIRLAQLFQDAPSSAAPSAATERARKVVILGVGEKRAALLVDELLGQESTVVKPLGTYLHRCSSLAGATISGDGRVRLVLDPAGLLAASQSLTPAFRKASA